MIQDLENELLEAARQKVEGILVEPIRTSYQESVAARVAAGVALEEIRAQQSRTISLGTEAPLARNKSCMAHVVYLTKGDLSSIENKEKQ